MNAPSPVVAHYRDVFEHVRPALTATDVLTAEQPAFRAR